jgi:DNA-binding response OmpR family regulator
MSAGQTPHAGEEKRTATVLVYASDRTVRTAVRRALGRKVAADLPRVEVLETATQPAAVKAIEAGGIDVIVLDGEARPGGMGVCRQLKDEIFDCPPTALITGRADDAWLATWSRADAVMPRPLDPFRLPGLVAALLRRRLGQPSLP